MAISVVLNENHWAVSDHRAFECTVNAEFKTNAINKCYILNEGYLSRRVWSATIRRVVAAGSGGRKPTGKACPFKVKHSKQGQGHFDETTPSLLTKNGKYSRC
jgi:hypothetical protein